MSVDVLYTHRQDAFTHLGGDSLHALECLRLMNERGFRAVGAWEELPKDFHPRLIHHFNVSRPDQAVAALGRFPQARLILHALYVDYASTERRARGGRALLQNALGSDGMEYAKTWGRWLKGQRPFPGVRYALSGHRRTVLGLLKKAARVVFATEDERSRLFEDYQIQAPASIVPPPSRFPPLKLERTGRVVLCAARLEPLKNQLNLIRAVRNTTFELVLAGAPAPQHAAYERLCRAEAGPNVRFTGSLGPEALWAEYARARIHALPSHFETTGLSTVEAMGAGLGTVVGAGGGVRELFSDRSEIGHPDQPDDIAQALERACAHTQEQRSENAHWARTYFGAETVGSALEQVYRSVLVPNAPRA
ncbi:glycosyltransferase [bacterium]|nr:glycosyltransferase [bacterium]